MHNHPFKSNLGRKRAHGTGFTPSTRGVPFRMRASLVDASRKIDRGTVASIRGGAHRLAYIAKTCMEMESVEAGKRIYLTAGEKFMEVGERKKAEECFKKAGVDDVEKHIEKLGFTQP